MNRRLDPTRLDPGRLRTPWTNDRKTKHPKRHGELALTLRSYGRFGAKRRWCGSEDQRPQIGRAATRRSHRWGRHRSISDSLAASSVTTKTLSLALSAVAYSRRTLLVSAMF